MRLVLIPLLTAGLLAAPQEPARKLTDDEKIELIRGLTAEYAKVVVYLPRAKKALRFNSNGTWDKAEWQVTGREFGAVAKTGDLVQVTRIDIESDRIVLQIDGGLNTRGKWYERIEGGVGSGNRTRPLSGNQTRSAGTTLALHFPGRVPPINSEEVKKLLLPVLNFEKRSVTQSYMESLPAEVQQAIKENRAMAGMDRQQVKLAIGDPREKIRETVDGQEQEDWIYGLPPGKITFVTFANGKVIKVKDHYAALGGTVAPALKPPQ
jgi:hypothetical protein